MGVENFLLNNAKTHNVQLTINRQKQKAKIPKTWTKEEVMEKLAQIEKKEKKNDKDIKKATLRLQFLQTQLLRMNMEKDTMHEVLQELK